MIDPYTEFERAADGSIVARRGDESVLIADHWTDSQQGTTAVRAAVPGETVSTSRGPEGLELAVSRHEAIERLATATDEDGAPFVPDQRHAAAVLDFLAAENHYDREEEGVYVFRPPDDRVTGIGYAGALLAVADTIEATVEGIRTIEATFADRDEDVPPEDERPEVIDEVEGRIDALPEQRRQLESAAELIRSNAYTIATTAVRDETLERLDLEAVDRLGDAIDGLTQVAEAMETAGADEDTAGDASDEDPDAEPDGTTDEEG